MAVAEDPAGSRRAPRIVTHKVAQMGGMVGAAIAADAVGCNERTSPMIQIACPWCEDDAPVDVDVLQAAGGRYTCPACLTTVELVDPMPETLPLAA